MKNNTFYDVLYYFRARNIKTKDMWRVKFCLFLLLGAAAGMTSNAQSLSQIMEFLGAGTEEELDPYDVEKLEDLVRNPLEINLATRSALDESGLFTPYQTASLKDYVSRHGDILSLNEMSLVDGFSPSIVAKLAPFISLEGGGIPGQSGRTGMKSDLAVRMGMKKGALPAYGMKYKLTVGQRVSGGLSVSRTTEAAKWAPDAFSGHAAVHFKRGGKILIGDFNARFGQGLSLWNGLGLSGLSSASSFMRRPSGLSPSSSFTGGYSLRGIAGEIDAGRTRITVLAAMKQGRDHVSVMPALSVSRFFRNCQAGITHYADFTISSSKVRIPDMKTSADLALCCRGTDIFGEAVFDWVSSKVAALAGISAPAGDNARISAMLRYYPAEFSSSRSSAARSTTKCSNECAASFAADFSAGKWISVNGSAGFGSSVKRFSCKSSADCAYFPVRKSSDLRKSLQVKLQSEWNVMITGSFKAVMRLSERIRTWGEPFRTDIRADFSYVSRHFVSTVRLNALHSVGTGLLGYAEGGCKNENISVYLRQGIFRIDNWADRIYAYERDAPGSFNVPAYYGRGIWTALAMNWKFARWGRMHLRAAWTSYPFMAEEKPGRAELKLHFSFIF